MPPRRIIIDCDPGVDDAIAILLALASPEVQVEAITTVIGNVSLAKTTANARRITDLAGRPDIPIHAGCVRPLMAPIERSGSVHGGDGLGDIGLPEPSAPALPGHAVDVIIERVKASPGEITLCPIGPMTNIAMALVKAPEIAPLIREIVFMGGAAFCPGNTTPAAEFNISIDPEAAQIMVTAGVPLTMFGLDVTRQAPVTEDWLADLEAAGSPAAKAAVAMMRAYAHGDPCLHDPCVIAHLIDPTLFGGVAARLSVDCTEGPSRGRTLAAVSERHRKGAAATAEVITELDADRLFTLLHARIATGA